MQISLVELQTEIDKLTKKVDDFHNKPTIFLTLLCLFILTLAMIIQSLKIDLFIRLVSLSLILGIYVVASFFTTLISKKQNQKIQPLEQELARLRDIYNNALHDTKVEI
jgi:succinate-acetate transporter protein